MTIPNISTVTQVASTLKEINLGLLDLSKKLNLSLDDLDQFKTAGKKLQNVEKEFTKFKDKGVKQGEELNKLLKDFTKAKSKIEETDKLAKATKKASDIATKVQEALFKNVPGSAALDKASRVGGILGILAAIGVVALAKLQEFVSSRIFDNLDNINSELTKANTTAVNNGLKLKSFDSKLQKFEKDLDANAKDYYRLNKQQDSFGKSIVEVKKQSNDALYETRQGRTILDGKIAESKKQSNDALYETRQNKQNLDGQITGLRSAFDAKIQSINSQISKFASNAGDTFQTAINSTIAKIQASLNSTQAQVAAIKQTLPVDTNAIVSRAVTEAKAVIATAIKQTPPVDTNAIVARAVTEAKAVIAPLEMVTDARLSAAQSQISTLSGAVSALGSAVQTTGASANEAKGKADLAVAAVKTEAQKLNEKFEKSVADNAKAFGVRDLSQTELSKEFDKLNAEFIKDADISSKIAQGNTALADQRWEETLKMQQEWLIESRKVEKITATFQLSVLPGLLRNIELKIEDKTSYALQSVANIKAGLEQQINNSENKTDDKLDELKTTSNKSLETLTKELEQQRNDFEETADENAKIAQGDTRLAEQRWDSTVKELEKTFDRKQDNSQKSLTNRIDKETIERKREDKSIVTTLGSQITNIEQQLDNPINTSPEVGQFSRELEKVKQDLTKIKPDVNDLKKRTKEQEKVNALALPKLDQILGLIPGLPGRAAAAIKPSIPTLPQIENAAATGTCRTTQPGGCMSKALDNNAANITNNANANTGNILGAVNAAGQGVDLALLGVINSKLGEQLPGGIGGKLSRFADWMHLDRVLNILIFGATIHNGLMLSSDIGQTFIGIINNVLTTIGLKKEDGSGFDIGAVISGTVESLVKGVVGAENYTNLTQAWAKANRIYQSTTNIFNALQGLSSVILTGLEMTAGKIGKIGNALRKSGEVLENAYGWFNPQPKFNRITQGLESVQATASTVLMVTQVPLDVVASVTELTNASTELTKAMKEDNKPENKGKEAPEPDKLKADELASKVNSTIANILPDDLFNGAD